MTGAAAALVVDASAVVLAASDPAALGDNARARLVGRARHAPHVVDAEIGSALRRRVARGQLSDERGAQARRDAADLVTWRHRQDGGLAQRAWELRHTVTFADGLYVALAETLACPLLTADERLASASGPRCAFEVLAG